MQEKRPTVADVAALAKVSLGTVSNVLNGSTPVSKDRRERVLKAIEELGYTQNMLAQGLRSNRSPIVGMCIPHTAIAYFSALVDAFDEIAASNNIELMLVLSRDDPETEFNRIKSLLNFRVGGIILVPCGQTAATYDMMAQSKVPVVIADRIPLPGKSFPFDCVTFDSRRIMCQAGRELIAKGHRDILFIVSKRNANVTLQRIEGLKDAARESGEDVGITVIDCNDETMLIAQLSSEMGKERRPGAIITSTNGLATWIMRAFRVLHIRCPEDVSLMSCDEPDWSTITTPTLSVIRQPTQRIARMAWAFLLQRMNDRECGLQQVQLEAEVIFRESVKNDLREID